MQKQQIVEALIALAPEIHAVNVKNGFWEEGKNRSVNQTAVLIVTELAEAVEAHRKYGFELKQKLSDLTFSPFEKVIFESWIKDTVEDEIADAVIRCLDAIEGYSPEQKNRKIHEITSVNKCPVNFIDGMQRLMLQACQPYYAKMPGTWLILLCHLVDFAMRHSIAIIQHVKWKLAYNATRAYKHGKAY